jgi:predicted nucleic acid-binding protein
MLSSTKTRSHVAEARHQRGLIDTSVVIDLGRLNPADLPAEIAVSAVTLAELAAGPHATGSNGLRRRSSRFR